MDPSPDGPVKIMLIAHALLLVLAAMVVTAAVVAAQLAYPDDPTRMVLAGTLASIVLVLPAMLIGYPLVLRYLLARAGYAITWRRIALLTGSLIALAGLSALLPAGAQSGTGQSSDVDVLLIALICGWVGSLLGQIGIASMLDWSHPARAVRSKAQLGGSREARREQQRRSRRSGR